MNEEQFRYELEEIVPAPEQKHFLLAVSGGADSMVMAYLFENEQLHYEVAHCNFHLRGAASDADAEFVKNAPIFSERIVHIKDFDTLAEQQASGESVEMAARRLRYQWFAELAPRFDYVVTAHHANDNAETLLLNLARGTGLKGLTAIPPVNGNIVRPLLSFTATEIRDFAKKRKIPFRDDQSNFDDTFQRNKMRLHVIPELKNVNPNIVKTLCDDILTFRKQYDFYRKQIEVKINKFCKQRGDSFYLSINQLVKEDNAELLLYECLTDFNFNKEVISDIFRRLFRQSGKLFYSKTHQLVKDRACLVVMPREAEEYAPISIPDVQMLEAHGFSVQLVDYQEDMNFKADKNTIFVDADKLDYPLLLRRWEEGDHFVPFGRKTPKKVSDLLINEKIHRFAKRTQRILCSNDKIVWIVGLRADDRFKVVPGKTRKVLVIRELERERE